MHGSRISLLVGVASTLLGAGVGGLIGLVSGYLGGKTDLVAQRLMDIMQALPILVLALVMAAALGPSLVNTIIAISVVIVPRAARPARWIRPGPGPRACARGVRATIQIPRCRR